MRASVSKFLDDPRHAGDTGDMNDRITIVDRIKRDLSDAVERQHLSSGIVDGANEADHLDDIELSRRWRELETRLYAMLAEDDTDALAYQEGLVRAFETEMSHRFARRFG